jgi:hypothetical protein
MARSFILRTPQGNVTMREAIYPTEDLFQKMLADASEVLGGDQITPADPRRWLLISREMPIADRESGTARWSLDHLFLDQDGIPTFVEVKRSTDTRLRREVVGQMLEYAANGVVYWPLDDIQDRFAAQCDQKGRDTHEVLAEFLKLDIVNEAREEKYWGDVLANLRAGRIRLLFVADVIPPELTRIIEFLNKQMNPAEVLGIEVPLFVGEPGYELLVPSLVGQTAEAQAAKSTSGPRRLWDEESFYADLYDRHGEEGELTVRVIADWLQAHGGRAQYSGSGKTYGSLVALFEYDGITHRPFVIYGEGQVEIRFNHMMSTDPFSDRASRMELLRRLNQIDGANLPENRVDSRPNFHVRCLFDENQLQLFLNTWDWYLEQIRLAANLNGM